MAVLGIHDAYDAGAALVSNGRVVSAVNEERFTKLKNDVGFPAHSVRYLLKQLEGEEIKQVAIPWIGGSALFARVFPSLEVKRRRLWRREDPKPHKINMILKNFVFRILQNQNPKWIWKMAGKSIGSYQLGKKLDSLGVNKKIVFIDHHTSHAATAYYASGFKEALVITLDGAGDGLSGSVSVGDNGELRRINEFKASASLGLLYGAATIACNLRFSEDEGKLMSLAAYSYPTEIKELDEISHYDEDKRQLVSNAASKFEFLLAEYMKDNLLWKYEREAFAFAIQKHVEKQVIKIVKQYIEETKIHNIAVSGGSFSNIITNMLINELPEVKDFFVFPHMGDGGLALGAAYYFDFQENGKFANKQIDNIYYGPEYSNNEIEEVLKKYTKERRISYDEVKDIASYTAEKIAKENKIVCRDGMKVGLSSKDLR